MSRTPLSNLDALTRVVRRSTLFLVVGLFAGIASPGSVHAQSTGMQGDAAAHEFRSYGGQTASGERYDPESMTAASLDLPFDSLVRVTRVDNGRTVVVRINDRMPGDGHILHLSRAAARHIGIEDNSSALIRLEPLNGDRLTEIRSPSEIRDHLAAQRWARSTQETERDGPEVQTNGADSRTRGRLVTRGADSAGETQASPQRSQTVRDGAPRFTLQVGLFSSRSSAQSIAEEVRAGWVFPIGSANERQYRVYAGRYQTESEARTAQEALRRQGRESFLRPIES